MSDSNPPVHVVALELPRQPAVTAHYLPAQLRIDRVVPWTPQPAPGDIPALQYAAGQGRVLSIRLVLDNVTTSASVQPQLDLLARMTSVIDPEGPEAKRRPSRVALRWLGDTLPEFAGVIESMSVQYAQMLPDGTPVAATVDLRVREASRVAFSKHL